MSSLILVSVQNCPYASLCARARQSHFYFLHMVRLQQPQVRAFEQLFKDTSRIIGFFLQQQQKSNWLKFLIYYNSGAYILINFSVALEYLGILNPASQPKTESGPDQNTRISTRPKYPDPYHNPAGTYTTVCV